MDESYDLLTGEHFHVILHPNKVHGLIFNRLDKTVSTINYDDAKELSNVKYVGRVHGIVGRFLDRHLVLIKNRTKVGCLYEPISNTDHDVFVISQVQVIDLSIAATPSTNKAVNSVKYDAASDRDDFVDTTKHPDLHSMEMQQSDSFSSLPITINTNSYLSSQSRSSNWNPFKLANSLKPMVPTQFLRSSQASTGPVVQSNDNGQQSNPGSSRSASATQTVQVEDADKRLVDEMIKLFNNTNSFYYSPTLDLTNRFSRKNLIKKVGNEPVWRAADERFFWNKHMLKDLIELSKQDIDANHFICVILKGFIAIKEQIVGPIRHGSESDFAVLGEDGQQATSMRCFNTSTATSNNTYHCDTGNSSIPNSSNQSSTTCKYKPKTYRLALVSRRSVFQAGTRYRRRGCDKDGNCANYVETEQIFKADQHFTSMVILRGSIPLFWYQTGFNYRPPPVLTKSEDENHEAFSKHFTDLIHQYKTEQIIAVDCTEQSGREKALHDAYRRHIDKFRSSHPKIRLIEFDYHKYCRGRQCTDAQIERHLDACGLNEQLLKDVKYYWNDGGVILEQEGVFRVNCLDCSDRTNVVQRIIALQILDLQLARLGIIAPDISPEENQCKRIMQTMWSTNGNVLSTQYCGTRALFGGDRKLAGYLKDTYSSASRYYISKFRDVYRQAAIDAMLGVENIEAKNLETNQLRDQYELLSFDPLLASQRGGAILRDVGSRVTNRLSRLKGRFNVKPDSDTANSGFARFQHHRSGVPSNIAETGLIETLGEMTIDWPSSEDLVNHPIEAGQEVQEAQAQDVFARYAAYDDNFQDDDEFSHLMLSIDLAELQQLREQEGSEPSCTDTHACPDESKGDDENEPEAIDLKEARGISNQTGRREQIDGDKQQTNTTAT